MKIIETKFGYLKNKKPLTLAIGVFDGVHLGHIKILERLKHKDTKTAVLTFNKNPKHNNFLISMRDKIEVFKSLKIDYLFIIDFDFEMQNLSHLDFIKKLFENNVKRIVCGHDFHFGFDRKGKIDDLVHGFDVKVIPDEMYENLTISTSLIREKLEKANLNIANSMLGYPFYTKGIVEIGSGKGRKIGFKTANLKFDQNILTPAKGVYLTRTIIKNKAYYSITNVGINPTVSNTTNLKIETHIIDFDRDIYGEEIKIEYLKFLRVEEKFEDEKTLATFIKKDIEIAKELVFNYEGE